MRWSDGKIAVARRIATLCAAAISVAGVLSAPAYAGGGPPPDQPDEPLPAGDQSFVAALDAANFEYEGPKEAAATGKIVCFLSGEGHPAWEIIETLKKHNADLTRKRGRVFVAIAMQHFCPQFISGSGSQAGTPV